MVEADDVISGKKNREARSLKASMTTVKITAAISKSNYLDVL